MTSTEAASGDSSGGLTTDSSIESTLADAATHEYADNTIHTLQADSGRIFDIRLKRRLGGHRGFSNACVFLAECVTEHSDHFGNLFVVKIFDPRYSNRLRRNYGAGGFDPGSLSAVAAAFHNGGYRESEDKLVSIFEQPEHLSARSLEFLSCMGEAPFPYGEVFGQALFYEEVCEAYVADGIMSEPGLGEREIYCWILSQHMFEHEASMHRHLNCVPEAPVVQLKEVASIRPKSMAEMMPSMSFGAITMEIVDGVPASRLRDVCRLDEKSFKLAPASIRNLVPSDKKRGKQFFRELNRLIQFPATVAVESQDHHLDNIMCSARPDGKGVKLTWIDVGQFQPLAAKRYHQENPDLTVPKNMCLDRIHADVDEGLEDQIYERFSFLSGRFPSRNGSICGFKLRRVRDFGANIAMTFAWRLIMEDIMKNDWGNDSKPTDVRESVLLLEMAKNIMEREKAAVPQQNPGKKGVERQICFHGAVLKLHYLLCSSSDEDFETSTVRGFDTVERFEEVMSCAGYPKRCGTTSYDSKGNLILSDDKCTVATIDEVVLHLACSQGIFGPRSWEPDWPLGRIQGELRLRYEKVMKLKAYSWSAKGRLGWLAVEKLDAVQ